MGNRLYVGNLSYNSTEQGLRSEFEKCGTVTDVKIVTDRDTGRSRGFGFVQFSTDAEASNAITELDGASFDGRQLAVRIAEQRQNSRPGGGGARFNNSGGGNRNNAPSQGGGYNSGGGGYDGGGRGGGRDRKRRRDRDDSDWS